MRLLFFSVLSLLILGSHSVGAKASETNYLSFPNHSQAALLASHTHFSANEDGRLWVALHIQLDPEWHTYWKNPGDSGAAPLLEMRASDPAIEMGPLHWPTPLRISTPPLMTYGYEDQVLFRAEVKGFEKAEPGPVEITWEVEWLACKVECIPAFHSFQVMVEASEISQKSSHYELITTPSFQSYPESSILKAAYSEGPGQIEVHYALSDEDFDFFPDSTLHLSTQKPQRLAEGFSLQTSSSWKGEVVSGLLRTGNQAFYMEAHPKQPSLVPFLWGAFFGGLLLNLMPCVFPIISLKVFSALKGGGSHLSARLSHLSFVAGVLVTFLIIALALAGLRAAGHSLGWGFQLQSPGFLIFLILLFFVLSLNFLGLYEIRLPWLSGGAGADGPLGSFLSGGLAVVVASPCTAPFMGGAMGFAMSQSTPTLMAVFFGLGLGFAFPYVVLALFPALLSKLPRSGPWLQKFKEFMFFPMLWTTLWLLWIYAQIAGSTAAAGVMVALSLVAALFWWRGQAPSAALRRVGQLVFLLLAAGVLIISWNYGEHKLPMAHKTRADLIPWAPFDAKDLQDHINDGESVFVSFTASWCITCKVNEQVTFHSDEVRKFVEDRGIRMMVADWTRRDPDITHFMEQYQRISVPFYLFWPRGQRQPAILPEILTPQIFMNALEQHQNL